MENIIREMEEKYPVATAEFKRIAQEQYETFCLKQYNYGPDNIAMGKSLDKEEDRRLSMMGLFFRMNDKINRLKQLVLLNKEDMVSESVGDTLQDLSVYGIISQIILNGKWGR